MHRDNLARVARGRVTTCENLQQFVCSVRRSFPRHRVAALRTTIVAFLLLLTANATVGAQFIPPPAASSALPAKGDLWLSITSIWQPYDNRSGFTPATDARSEALGAPYSFTPIGVAQLPSLGTVEDAIASLAGNPQFGLSLGTTTLRAEVMKTVTPFEGELGLKSWLSFGVSVPLIRASGETVLDVNPDGTEGNVGFNPALTTAVARTTNTAVRNQITAAATTLEQRLVSCALTPTAPGCPAILARQTEAQTLITQSRNYRDVLESLYGSDTATAGQLIPIDGTTAHTAINGRIAAFNALYRDLLALGAMDTDPLLARPFPAQTALTATDLRRILEQPEFGYSFVPLLSFQRQGIGDIELRARLRLLNTFKADDTGGVGMRVSLSVLARIATGVPPDANVPFDVGTGDGQNDVEVGGAADLRLSRLFNLTALGRFGVQMPDRQAMRIAEPGTPFPEAFTLRDVDRDLGDYIDFSLRPRLQLGPYASLLGAWHFHSKMADHYTGTFIASAAETGRGPVTLDASVLDEGSAVTIQRAGVGLRLVNFENRQHPVSMPVEFSLTYMAQLGSTGYGVPDASTLSLQLRVITHLFGASRRLGAHGSDQVNK